MYYENKSAEVVKEGKWDEKSCVRRVGGYDIDKTTLPEGMKYLPKGAVLSLDKTSGKAVLVKTASLYEDAAQGATSLKVKKGHAVKVGDTLAGVAVTAIDTTQKDYDTLTVAATAAALTTGDVISDAEGKTILGLNYATVQLDDMPSCTPTLQAYEIEEDTLPYPVDDTIREGLTVRHAFKL